MFAEHLADFVLVCVAGYRVALGFDFDDIVSNSSDTGLRVGGDKSDSCTDSLCGFCDITDGLGVSGTGECDD